MERTTVRGRRSPGGEDGEEDEDGEYDAAANYDGLVHGVAERPGGLTNINCHFCEHETRHVPFRTDDGRASVKNRNGV